MSPRQFFKGTRDLEDWEGSASLCHVNMERVQRLSVSMGAFQLISAGCTVAFSTRLWRFWYVVLASGSSGSGMDRNIMTDAGVFCLGLRKY